MSESNLGSPPISDNPKKKRRESGGLDRRTLKEIEYYPEPEEIYEVVSKYEGELYSKDNEEYAIRDKALVCLVYLGCLRVSEAIRLRKSQFVLPGVLTATRFIIGKKRGRLRGPQTLCRVMGSPTIRNYV